MKFCFLLWVQLFYDFGKVVRSGTTQGYFRPYCCSHGLKQIFKIDLQFKIFKYFNPIKH